MKLVIGGVSEVIFTAEHAEDTQRIAELKHLILNLCVLCAFFAFLAVKMIF